MVSECIQERKPGINPSDVSQKTNLKFSLNIWMFKNSISVKIKVLWHHQRCAPLPETCQKSSQANFCALSIHLKVRQCCAASVGPENLEHIRLRHFSCTHSYINMRLLQVLGDIHARTSIFYVQIEPDDGL